MTTAADRAATLVPVSRVEGGWILSVACTPCAGVSTIEIEYFGDEDAGGSDNAREDAEREAGDIRAAIAREIAAAEREAARRALERAADLAFTNDPDSRLADAIRALAAEDERDG